LSGENEDETQRALPSCGGRGEEELQLKEKQREANEREGSRVKKCVPTIELSMAGITAERASEG
jgi:DNA topoisomerase VI subunit B